MKGNRIGCTAILALAVVTACADNPVSQPPGERAALATAGGDGFADRREGDRGDDRDGRRQIAMLDDCDRNDPGWTPTGGCAFRRGLVNVAEFNLLLASPLSLSVVGHPAWRNEPSYLTVE